MSMESYSSILANTCMSVDERRVFNLLEGFISSTELQGRPAFEWLPLI